ncbi:MAG: acyltransferase [Prevotella sp.]|nr:acyltransferase [Prevotella sp.]
MNNTTDYIATCRERVFGKNDRFYVMGIAILWIFVFHFYCWYKATRPWWIYFFSEGQIGVDIFLFLSAYGLEASFRKNSWQRFYKNRFVRIIPVNILFLLTVFGIFFPNVPLQSIATQCAAQLSGLSLFQEPGFFSSHFTFDWFSPALILFYVFFPLFSIVANKLSQKALYKEVLFLVALILLSLLFLRFVHLPIRQLLYRLPILALGVASYVHLASGNANRLLVLYAVFLLGGLLSNQHWVQTSACAPALLTLFALIQGHRPLYRFMCLLGRHSYEIYLAHIFPVTNWLMLHVYDNIYVYIAVTILWTIAVATIYSTFQHYIAKTYLTHCLQPLTNKNKN